MPNTLPEHKFIPLRQAEKKVFRRRHKYAGAIWAERNIYVPVGSRQGIMRHANNPPLYGIMQLATLPHVRTVVLGKGIQTGGTLAIYALLLREADYSRGADNALIVMADERSVRKLSKKRLQLMIDKSPTLSAIKSINPDDTTIYSITMADGFTIDIGWASSEMSVSSESYRIVILDEISKYKIKGNIQDAKGRTTVYPESKKIFILSSPGIDSDDPEERDPLMAEMEQCDVIYEYHVQCPACGAEQVMTDEQIKYPLQPSLLDGKATADAAAIRRLKLAWYECPHCMCRWNDYQRNKAVMAAMKHGWQPVDAAIREPQAVYFHYPAWLSPFMSLSECAARRIEAQGDDILLQKYENLVAGRTFRHEQKERPHAAILALRDDRPEGLVPSAPIAAITFIADMQKHGFWYKVTAWGYGLEQESWTLKTGFVDTWAALKQLAWESVFTDAAGNPYHITLRGMDSGGGESGSELTRTAEAYIFATENPGLVLFKGERNPSRHLSEPKPIDRIPGTNKPLPGTAVRYHFSNTFFKDKLAGKLQVNPADPGAWHLHKDIDTNFAAQMCAEYKTKQGYYECPKGKANHYWDCAAMELALVELAQVKFWPRPEMQAAASPGRRIHSGGVN